MKRASTILILSLFALASLFAGESGAGADYGPAKIYIEFYGRDNVETWEDEGSWYMSCEEAGIVVGIEPAEAFIAPKQLAAAKTVATALKDYGVEQFKFIEAKSMGPLTISYGTGTMVDGDGNDVCGLFGYLNNADVKGKTFFFAIIVPALDDKEAMKEAKSLITSMGWEP